MFTKVNLFSQNHFIITFYPLNSIIMSHQLNDAKKCVPFIIIVLNSMENMLFLLQYLIKVDTFDLEVESSH